MNETSCVACQEKGFKRRRRSYCSVVCRLLGEAGLGWRLWPYRIIDLASGAIVSTGPHFNLTPEGIAQLQKRAESKRPNAPEQATLAGIESRAMPWPPQSPRCDPTFSKNFLGRLI